MRYPACLRSAFLAFSLSLSGAIAVLSLNSCSTSPAPVAPPAFASLPDTHFDIPAIDDGLPGAGVIRRYDWFKKLWRERRVAWAHSVQPDQHAIVFLGDSITQGWNELLPTSFPGLKVVNRGISGDTTRGVLIRLEEDVLAVRPSAVVILIGTNDLDEHMEPEAIVANLQLIIAALKQSNPSLPVILCEVFPSSPAKNRPAEKIKKINHLLKAVVRDQPQVTYVDTWTLFANAQGDAKLEEFPDLLHPNAIGYAKWAGAIRPVFATLGFLDTEPDAFKPEPGFVSLFNGKDLSGWGYRPTTPADIESGKRWKASDPAGAAEWPVNTAPVNFDGKKASPDGRFIAKNGRLVVTTPTEFRKIQQLWTTREFPKNFTLKLEFRATPNTDSGVYLRGPQLQCRDYLLAGPYKTLQHYRAGDWNEMVVTVTGNVAHSTCNGEVLEDAMPVPATGPIGLEGDRGQMEYRRIRLQELP